jgi:hypothetical protein
MSAWTLPYGKLGCGTIDKDLTSVRILTNQVRQNIGRTDLELVHHVDEGLKVENGFEALNTAHHNLLRLAVA